MQATPVRAVYRWRAATCAALVLAGPVPNALAAAAGLYVADSSGNRVVRFKSPVKKGESESLVLGQPDFTSGGGSGAQNGMNEPWSLIFQPSSNILWVADFANSRVLGFRHGMAAFTNGQNADLVLGQPDFSNPNPVCAVTQSGLCFPADVAFDQGGNIWVADQGANRVLEYKPPFTTGQSAALVIGEPDFTSSSCVTAQNRLCSPYGLTFDKSGNLWVLDAGNDRILEYKPPFANGQNASVVLGESDFTTRICRVTQNGMCPAEFAGGVRSDNSGNIWMVDVFDNRVIEFQAGAGFVNGQNASVVLGQADFTSSSCATTQSGMCFPGGIAFDTKGSLYVAEESNCRVLKFKPKKKKFSNNQKAMLVLGQPDFTSNGCNVTQSNLQNPNGLGFGP